MTVLQSGIYTSQSYLCNSTVGNEMIFYEGDTRFLGKMGITARKLMNFQAGLNSITLHAFILSEDAIKNMSH
jgi:hypothetical protein